jgi:hypothetical protein
MRVVGPRAASISLAALAFLTGCDNSDDQIKVYRVAKAPLDSPTSEKPPMPTNAASPAFPAGVAPTGATSVTTPPNWEPQPPSQMRQASFLVKGENGSAADISLVVLGAAAGNVLENVNRWLSQLGEPAINAEKLADTVQHLSTPRGDVVVVDLAGVPENGDAAKDGRIIAAMASEEGKTAFFKMRGNPTLVGAQKENFLNWVSSVRSPNGTATATESEARAKSDKPQIKWEVPAGWSPAPPSAMRYASFTATGDTGDKIDISVVTFPGDGGSDAENVNRWRQQIGLPAADASALKSTIVPVKSGDTDFSSIDMTGANSRLLAAWARRDGHTWFFKLTGPSSAVEKEKSKFVKFLQSVRF